MDDYNTSMLSEAKNEYCIRLLNILTPLVILGIKSIFSEAVDLCDENNEEEKYLMTFQNFLSRVPKWNANIIKDETKRIVNESKLKEVLKWSWERRGKKIETFEFEMKEPDYQRINNNQNLLITWIGHESFLYQNKDINILTDPHFSERASPFTFAGPKRYMDPGMKIDDLPKIDVVTISHSHYDHLDYQTVKLLSKKFNDVLFIVPLGLKEWFEGKGIYNVKELDWWDSIKVKQTNITFAPACRAASGVAINVFVGIIIDFPLTFKALKGISKALVPLFTATANFTPINLAKSSSK